MTPPQKIHCPQCGSSSVELTCMFIHKGLPDTNSAYCCVCLWKGYAHQLLTQEQVRMTSEGIDPVVVQTLFTHEITHNHRELEPDIYLPVRQDAGKMKPSVLPIPLTEVLRRVQEERVQIAIEEGLPLWVGFAEVGSGYRYMSRCWIANQGWSPHSVHLILHRYVQQKESTAPTYDEVEPDV